MKKSVLCKWLIAGCVCLSATGCSKDEPVNPDEGSVISLPKHRMYILNEGNWNMNNACISFYAPSDSEVAPIADIFYQQNGRMLGDNGQAMIESNGHIYVAVTGSNYLAKLNSACVEEAELSFVTDQQLQGGIRGIVAHGGYIYASFYGGYVAKINAATLEIEDKLKTTGNNLEGITVCGDRLYVANAYKIITVDGSNIYDYLPEMIVINLDRFSQEDIITVSPNPNLLMSKGDKVYLISWTDYASSEYCLQVIDPKDNNKVTEICNATHFAAGKDKVYIGYSETDWSTWTTHNTYSSYDIATGTHSKESFLKNPPAEVINGNLYMIAVDPSDQNIYIGITNYAAANGDVYRFDKDGNYIGKIDSGGQNPRAAVFIN